MSPDRPQNPDKPPLQKDPRIEEEKDALTKRFSTPPTKPSGAGSLVDEKDQLMSSFSSTPTERHVKTQPRAVPSAPPNKVTDHNTQEQKIKDQIKEAHAYLQTRFEKIKGSRGPSFLEKIGGSFARIKERVFSRVAHGTKRIEEKGGSPDQVDRAKAAGGALVAKTEDALDKFNRKIDASSPRSGDAVSPEPLESSILAGENGAPTVDSKKVSATDTIFMEKEADDASAPLRESLATAQAGGRERGLRQESLVDSKTEKILASTESSVEKAAQRAQSGIDKIRKEKPASKFIAKARGISSEFLRKTIGRAVDFIVKTVAEGQPETSDSERRLEQRIVGFFRDLKNFPALHGEALGKTLAEIVAATPSLKKLPSLEELLREKPVAKTQPRTPPLSKKESSPKEIYGPEIPPALLERRISPPEAFGPPESLATPPLQNRTKPDEIYGPPESLATLKKAPKTKEVPEDEDILGLSEIFGQPFGVEASGTQIPPQEKTVGGGESDIYDVMSRIKENTPSPTGRIGRTKILERIGNFSSNQKERIKNLSENGWRLIEHLYRGVRSSEIVQRANMLHDQRLVEKSAIDAFTKKLALEETQKKINELELKSELFEEQLRKSAELLGHMPKGSLKEKMKIDRDLRDYQAKADRLRTMLEFSAGRTELYEERRNMVCHKAIERVSQQLEPHELNLAEIRSKERQLGVEILRLREDKRGFENKIKTLQEQAEDTMFKFQKHALKKALKDIRYEMEELQKLQAEKEEYYFKTKAKRIETEGVVNIFRDKKNHLVRLSKYRPSEKVRAPKRKDEQIEEESAREEREEKEGVNTGPAPRTERGGEGGEQENKKRTMIARGFITRWNERFGSDLKIDPKDFIGISKTMEKENGITAEQFLSYLQIYWARLPKKKQISEKKFMNHRKMFERIIKQLFS